MALQQSRSWASKNISSAASVSFLVRDPLGPFFFSFVMCQPVWFHHSLNRHKSGELQPSWQVLSGFTPPLPFELLTSCFLFLLVSFTAGRPLASSLSVAAFLWLLCLANRGFVHSRLLEGVSSGAFAKWTNWVGKPVQWYHPRSSSWPPALWLPQIHASERFTIVAHTIALIRLIKAIINIKVVATRKVSRKLGKVCPHFCHWAFKYVRDASDKYMYKTKLMVVNATTVSADAILENEVCWH